VAISLSSLVLLGTGLRYARNDTIIGMRLCVLVSLWFNTGSGPRRCPRIGAQRLGLRPDADSAAARVTEIGIETHPAANFGLGPLDRGAKRLCLLQGSRDVFDTDVNVDAGLGHLLDYHAMFLYLGTICGIDGILDAV